MEKMPVIETERLILRPFRVADAPDFSQITRDRTLQRFLPELFHEHFYECLHDVASVYAACKFEQDFHFVIEEKSTGKVVGAIFCTLVHDFNTTFFIARSRRNKGYMHEAMAAFIDFMPKGGALLFKVHPNNIAALAVVRDIVGIEDVYYIYGNGDNFKYYRRIL